MHIARSKGSQELVAHNARVRTAPEHAAVAVRHADEGMITERRRARLVEEAPNVIAGEHAAKEMSPSPAQQCGRCGAADHVGQYWNGVRLEPRRRKGKGRSDN
jgi:hypothetical protein